MDLVLPCTSGTNPSEQTDRQSYRQSCRCCMKQKRHSFGRTILPCSTKKSLISSSCCKTGTWSNGLLPPPWILGTFLLVTLLSGVSAQFTTQPQERPYYLTAGSSQKLDCSVQDKFIDDPEYTLQWIKLVGNRPRVISLASSVLQSDHYDLLETSSKGAYHLFIRNVSYARDNGNFFCQLTGPGGRVDDSRPAQVVVLVPPEPPTISNQPGSPVAEGEIVQAVCQSVGGNPPPTVQWQFSNGTKLPVELTLVRNATELSGSTESVLRWRVTSSENGKRLVCRIWNEAMKSDNWMEITTQPMTVLYAPKVQVGPVDVYNVEKDKEAQLSCNAIGNPPVGIPNYSWIHTQSRKRYDGQKNLSFRVEKESAGNYSCVVSNSQGNGEAKLQVNVLYGPEVNVEPKLIVPEGQELVLTCTVEANPNAVSVQWTGPGGSSNTNVLKIPNVLRENRGNYTCTAKNTLSLFKVGSVSRQGKDTSSVEVAYKPGQAKISLMHSPILVKDVVTLKCKAEETGFPPAKFKWKTPNAPDFEPNPRTEYVIDNVQLTHAGDYECLPYNTAGQGQSERFRLDVIEPARIDQFDSTEVERQEGDRRINWKCVATGHPPPKISWFKAGQPIEENGHWIVSQTNDDQLCAAAERCSYRVIGKLEWRDEVHWNDKGIYKCQASNGAGQPQESTKVLRVRHGPHIVNDRTQVLTAANLGDPAQITCFVSALPEPSFRWFMKGDEISAGGRYRFKSNINKTSQVFSNILTIDQVRDEDFGEDAYACQAANTLGESQKQAFALRKKSVPQPPADLRMLAGGATWLTMGWDPGFDGGHKQLFELEMRPVDPLSNEAVEQKKVSYSIEPTLTIYARRKRAALPRPLPESKNITGLEPLTSYKFRVRSKNQLGITEWSSYVSTSTVDEVESPFFPEQKQPTEARYDSDSNSLEFKPSIDPTLFCVMIYMKVNKEWRRYDCMRAGSNANIPPADSMQIRFCTIEQPARCSKKIDVQDVTSPSSALQEFIIPLIVVVAAILAVAAVILLCCCMKRRKNEKPMQKRNKDYEMETNQARPKAISAPYMDSSEKQTMEVHGGSQADSGVFTMATTQYRAASFDPNAGYGEPQIGYTNGALRSSYDDGADRWGNAGDPYGDMVPGDPYLNNGYPQATEYPDMGYQSQQELGYGYYDPYGNPQGMVDLNPGGAIPMDHDDGASDFSTPSSRRVMREIIV